MAPASDRIPPTTHTSSSSEEREECSDPAVPRLSKGNTSCRSKNQGSPRGANLYYRTYEQKRILEERLQAERETKQKEEMNHVTGRPLITKRAAKMVPKGALFAERASLWYERVQAKREKLEARLRDEERSTASFTPTLNDERNKRIAQRGYIGPVQGWEQHFARYCAKKNVEDNPRSLALDFKPSINKASHVERTTVHTNVPASERLYQNAKHLHEKHEEAVRAMRAAPLRDPCTGNELFRPSTNRSSSRDRASKPRDPDDVTKLLYEQHEILKKKKEELVAQARKQRTFPFKPTIDQHSVSLLEKVERPPLYLSPSRQQPSTSAEGRAKDVSCDKHRSASTELPPKRKPINVGKFLQRAEFTQRQREHMLSALRELAEAREAQECTFTPHISETSERIFDASLYQRTGLTPSLIAPPGASSTARKWSSTQSYQDPKSLNRERVSSYDLQIPKTPHSPNPAPRHEPNKRYRQTVYQPNTNRRADTRSLSPGGKILEAMNTKSLAGSLGGSVTLHAHGNVSDFENEMSHVLHQWKAVEGETSGNLSHRW